MISFHMAKEAQGGKATITDAEDVWETRSAVTGNVTVTMEAV